MQRPIGEEQKTGRNRGDGPGITFLTTFQGCIHGMSGASSHVLNVMVWRRHRSRRLARDEIRKQGSDQGEGTFVIPSP